jgi:hypothetical protein
MSFASCKFILPLEERSAIVLEESSLALEVFQVAVLAMPRFPDGCMLVHAVMIAAEMAEIPNTFLKVIPSPRP